jgi:hypothetical protein
MILANIVRQPTHSVASTGEGTLGQNIHPKPDWKDVIERDLRTIPLSVIVTLWMGGRVGKPTLN